MNYNYIALHTGNNCTVQEHYSKYFNGTWANSGSNKGCSIKAPKGTFQDAFNAAGGGVFALQWDRNNYIRVWNFINPNIPDDIKNVCFYEAMTKSAPFFCFYHNFFLLQMRFPPKPKIYLRQIKYAQQLPAKNRKKLIRYV